MPTIFQLAKDDFLDSYDAPASTAKWMVTDTEDPVAVAALVLANVPAFDPFNNPAIDYRPQHQGGGVWVVEVRYGPIPPLNTGLTIWEIDTTGGREKRYQSLATRYAQKPSDTVSSGSGGSAGVLNFNGAIGVDETRVEGVDVSIPKMALVGKRKYKTLQLPNNYVEQLEGITATINAASFSITYWGQSIDFSAGELLFLGAVVTVATETQLEIDHRFEASRDRLSTNSPANPVTLAGFSAAVNKPGWDYSWIAFQRGATGNYRTQVPIQYQSEKVYPDGDFTVLIL